MAGSTYAISAAVINWELCVLRVIESRVQPVGRGMAVLASRGEELRLRFMAGIGRVVVIRLMATNASSRKRRVIVVHVAVYALARRNGMRSRQREGRVVVVERRIRPHRGVVAQFALLRESSRYVGGIRGVLEIVQMACNASSAAQAVIVVDMAIRALPRWHGMSASERKSGCGVIELGVGPQNRVVAGLAGGWKSCGDVRHRGDRVRIILLVARNARGVGQVVIVIDMAIGALPRRGSVRSGERKSGTVVIERGIEPRCRVMALLARLREILRNVIRIGRALEISQVARDASRGRQIVVIVDMAIDALAGRDRVHAGQRKPGVVVIKRGAEPRRRAMALLAGLWEACRHMVRIGRALEIF